MAPPCAGVSEGTAALDDGAGSAPAWLPPFLPPLGAGVSDGAALEGATALDGAADEALFWPPRPRPGRALDEGAAETDAETLDAEALIDADAEGTALEDADTLEVADTLAEAD